MFKDATSTPKHLLPAGSFSYIKLYHWTAKGLREGSFITDAFQLRNKEGKVDLKYHHFGAPNTLVDLGIAY